LPTERVRLQIPMLTAPTIATRRGALAAATEILTAAGIDSARADAEWLLAGSLGVGRAALHLDTGLPPAVAARYERAVRRRALREPLQRILGWEEFHGLRFRITDAVLVPRPETEMLVDWTLTLLPRPVPGRRLIAVDAGTGSGCIACILARRRDDVDAVALDTAFEAVALARANVADLGLRDRVRVVAGDLLTAIRRGHADLVISNPPYLPTGILASLEPEVAEHEPRVALDGGADGLDVIRRLVFDARPVLAQNGAFSLETAGWAQTQAAVRLMNEAGFRQVMVHNDLAGVERFVAGRA
jgi:release factor glutamine methyltransferase